MTRNSSKSNELKVVNPVRGRGVRHHPNKENLLCLNQSNRVYHKFWIVNINLKEFLQEQKLHSK